MSSAEIRGRCGHHFTRAARTKDMPRKHGQMHIESVDCADCTERAVLRLYDDERDDPGRFMPPDGRLSITRKDTT